MDETRGNLGHAAQPSFTDAVGIWAKIGIMSFGGPAGQIALMHRVLVDERRWIDERSYLQALNFCMLLPGPEAMQLATYVGWRLHGVPGGLVAGLLFVLPGALVILALSALYAAFGAVPVAAALLLGVKAAVLAIVVEALIRIARRGLKATADRWLAALAFVAIFFFAVPFPLIVLAAAIYGYVSARSDPSSGTAVAAASIALGATLRTVAIWSAIWLVPLFVLVVIAGSGHVLTHVGLFFSKLAVVTFGGAYAVLAYMAQDAVQHYGWLTAPEMVDGLGLAETTPGPLILVTEFVGFMAAFRHGGGNPWLMGVLGALVTLWATFAPCFLWIFAGAPYVERLNADPRLRAALSAVTAAVVGVILNLTVWFGLNVLFTRVGETRVGPLRLFVPDAASLSVLALGLSALAAFLLLRRRYGVLATLAICGGISMIAAMLPLPA